MSIGRRELLTGLASTALVFNVSEVARASEGTAMVSVRPAKETDVPAMVALIEARRLEYQTYEPVFWRKAQDSQQKTTPFFTAQLTNPRAVTLVSEDGGRITGFLMVVETPAPPVYFPGGTTVLVDDFCVDHPELWLTVGRALLDGVRAIGKTRSWHQIVVVNAWRDEAKAQLLREWNLSLASTWWTTTL